MKLLPFSEFKLDLENDGSRVWNKTITQVSLMGHCVSILNNSLVLIVSFLNFFFLKSLWVARWVPGMFFLFEECSIN